jgi:FMN phosphatase YigB (HAD superfamily)
MNEKTSLQRSLFPRFFLRAISLFTMIVFLGTSFPAQTFAQTPSSSNVLGGTDASLLASASATSGKAQELVIPPELGSISEAYFGNRMEDEGGRRTKSQTSSALRLPPSDQFVVLIPDAHSIPDAQRSLEKLIEYLQENYGVSTVALEGAEGKLDPTLFRLFPNANQRDNVFEDYLASGELSGAAAASVLSPHKANYIGIEDWELYEQGVAAFLEGLGKQADLRSQISNLKSELQPLKSKCYSHEALEFDAKLSAWDVEPSKLTEFIAFLSKYYVPNTKRPAHGTSNAVLGPLFVAMAQEGKSDPKFEAEVKKLAQHAHKAAPSAKLNGLVQDYRTGRLSVAGLAYQITEYLKENKKSPLPISSALQKLITGHALIAAVKGPDLMAELESFIGSVCSDLFATPESKAISKLDKQLRLLEKLSKFELSRSEWIEISAAHNAQRSTNRTETKEIQMLGNDVLSVWNSEEVKVFLSFYEIALKRESVFISRVNGLLSVNKRSVLRAARCAVVTGGFHTEGLAAKLKEQGIAYAVVSPAMKEIPQDNLYFDHMQGKVSWQKYFRPQNGKIDLYDAFARATTERLLRTPDRRLQTVDFKNWRDEVIRTLAQEGRVAEHSRYTRYIDQAVAGDSDEFQALRTKWTAQLEKFIEKLQWLGKTHQMTEGNIAKLLSRPANQTPYAVASLRPRASIPEVVPPVAREATRREISAKPMAVPTKENLRSEARSSMTFGVLPGPKLAVLGKDADTKLLRIPDAEAFDAFMQPIFQQAGVRAEIETPMVRLVRIRNDQTLFFEGNIGKRVGIIAVNLGTKDLSSVAEPSFKFLGFPTPTREDYLVVTQPAEVRFSDGHATISWLPVAARSEIREILMLGIAVGLASAAVVFRLIKKIQKDREKQRQLQKLGLDSGAVTQKAKKPFVVRWREGLRSLISRAKYFPVSFFDKQWAFVRKRPLLFRPYIRYLIGLQKKKMTVFEDKDLAPPKRELASGLANMDAALEKRKLFPYAILDTIIQTTIHPIHDEKLGLVLLSRLEKLLADPNEDPHVHSAVLAGLGAILASTDQDAVAKEAVRILNDSYTYKWLGEADHASIVQFLTLMIRSEEYFRIRDFVRRITQLKMPEKVRSLILGEVLERLVFMRPDVFTLEILDLLAVFFKNAPQFRYFLFFLMTRKNGVEPATKERAKALLEARGQFPLHEKVRQALGSGKKRVLIVHNIRDGMGDEVIRVNPILSALLDFNPELEVTLVTHRTFLWDHPRVHVVWKKNADGLFDQPYDAVINHFDEKQNWSEPLQKTLLSFLRKSPPSTLYAESFRFIHDSDFHFLFKHLWVLGKDYAVSAGLNRPRVHGIYEPFYRFLAELGMPFSAGEEKPLSGSPVVGIPNPDARAAWDQLLTQKRNLGADGRPVRPVALVNAFGGGGEWKGFTLRDPFKELQQPSDYASLASQLRYLVQKGYFVVLVPNGTDWGSHFLAQEVLDVLLRGDEALDHIVVAPDPEKSSRNEDAIDPSKTTSSKYLKYWSSYADEIFTVEGGLMHLAYALGKPYGTKLVSQSGLAPWSPYGESVGQNMGPSFVRLLSKRIKAKAKSTEDISGKTVASEPIRSEVRGVEKANRLMLVKALGVAVSDILTLDLKADKQTTFTAFQDYAHGQNGVASIEEGDAAWLDPKAGAELYERLSQKTRVLAAYILFHFPDEDALALHEMEDAEGRPFFQTDERKLAFILNEMVKNAIVHGHKLNLKIPVLLQWKTDLKKRIFRVRIANTLEQNDELVKKIGIAKIRDVLKMGGEGKAEEIIRHMTDGRVPIRRTLNDGSVISELEIPFASRSETRVTGVRLEEEFKEKFPTDYELMLAMFGEMLLENRFLAPFFEKLIRSEKHPLTEKRAQYFASLLRIENEGFGDEEPSLSYEVKRGKRTLDKTLPYSKLEQDFLDWAVKMNVAREEFPLAYGFYVQRVEEEREKQGPKTVFHVRAGNQLGDDIFKRLVQSRKERLKEPLTFYKGNVASEKDLRWIRTLRSDDVLSRILKEAGIDLKDLRLGVHDPSFLDQEGVYDLYLFTTNPVFIRKASQVVEVHLPDTTPVGYAQISVLGGVPTINAFQPRFYLPYSTNPALRDYVEGCMKALGLLIETHVQDVLKSKKPVSQLRFLTPGYFLSGLKARESTIQHYYLTIPRILGYSLKALPQPITGGYQHINFVFEKQLSGSSRSELRSGPPVEESEVRGQGKIRAEIDKATGLKNDARMRARQFLRYNRELLQWFLALKDARARSSTEEAKEEQTLILEKIRDYAEILREIAGDIRPDQGEGIEGEKALYQRLNDYAVTPPSGIRQGEVTNALTEESQVLRDKIAGLQKQFLEAHRARDMERLRDLNAQVAVLYKARLKVQLLQAASYLLDEKLLETAFNENQLLTILTAIRIGYLKLSHEYGWRVRRALQEDETQKIKIVGQSGDVAEVYDYANFKIATGLDSKGRPEPVTIFQDVWVRKDLEDGSFTYQPEKKAIVFKSMEDAVRGRFHTLANQEVDYGRVYDRINEVDYIADLLEVYGADLPGYYLDDIQESVDFIMNARRGGIGKKSARVDQKQNAANNIRTAMAEMKAGNILRAIEMFGAAKTELEARLKILMDKKAGVFSQTQYLADRYRLRETARAVREIEGLRDAGHFKEAHRLLQVLYKTHYLAKVDEETQYASLQRHVISLGVSFKRLAEDKNISDRVRENVLSFIQGDMDRVKTMTRLNRSETRSEIRVGEQPLFEWAGGINDFSALRAAWETKGMPVLRELPEARTDKDFWERELAERIEEGRNFIDYRQPDLFEARKNSDPIVHLEPVVKEHEVGFLRTFYHLTGKDEESVSLRQEGPLFVLEYQKVYHAGLRASSRYSTRLNFGTHGLRIHVQAHDANTRLKPVSPDQLDQSVSWQDLGLPEGYLPSVRFYGDGSLTLVLDPAVLAKVEGLEVPHVRLEARSEVRNGSEDPGEQIALAMARKEYLSKDLAALASEFPEIKTRFFDYLPAVARVVNPEGERKVAWYVNAGGDLLHPFYAMNPEVLIMSDWRDFGGGTTYETLENLTRARVMVLEPRMDEGSDLDRASHEFGINVRFFVKSALFLMGAQDIRIEKMGSAAEEFYRIRFTWKHPGDKRAARERTVYYLGKVKTQSLRAGHFPDEVRSAIEQNQGLDLFMEKAPNYYSEEIQDHVDPKRMGDLSFDEWHEKLLGSAKAEVDAVNQLQHDLLKPGGIALSDDERSIPNQGLLEEWFVRQEDKYGDSPSSAIALGRKFPGEFEPVELSQDIRRLQGQGWYGWLRRKDAQGWGNGRLVLHRRVSESVALKTRSEVRTRPSLLNHPKYGAKIRDLIWKYWNDPSAKKISREKFAQKINQRFSHAIQNGGYASLDAWTIKEFCQAFSVNEPSFYNDPEWVAFYLGRRDYYKLTNAPEKLRQKNPGLYKAALREGWKEKGGKWLAPDTLTTVRSEVRDASEYVLKQQLKKDEKDLAEQLVQYFSRNGLDKVFSAKISVTLMRAGPAMYDLWEKWGMLSREQSEWLQSGQISKIEGSKEFADRMRAFIAEYATLSEFKRKAAYQRLVPLTVVRQEVAKGIPEAVAFSLLRTRFSNFLILDVIRDFVQSKKNEVGGTRNAWEIVVKQGYENAEDWIRQAKVFVEAYKDKVGGEAYAWRIAVAHGLKKIKTWVAKAQEFVTAHQGEIGESLAWRIVIFRGVTEEKDPETGEIFTGAEKWFRGAKVFVQDRVKESPEDELALGSYLWNTVITHGLEKGAVWFVTAKKIVEDYSGKVNGRTNAWQILIRQGISGTPAWIKKARKIVTRIQGKVGGESNAWRLTINYGLEGVEKWIGEHSDAVTKQIESGATVSRAWFDAFNKHENRSEVRGGAPKKDVPRKRADKMVYIGGQYLPVLANYWATIQYRRALELLRIQSLEEDLRKVRFRSELRSGASRWNEAWALQVPWEETIRNPVREPQPVTQNQKNYFKNQQELREEWIRLLFRIKNDDAFYAFAFERELDRIHRILFDGRDGQSPYIPDSIRWTEDEWAQFQSNPGLFKGYTLWASTQRFEALFEQISEFTSGPLNQPKGMVKDLLYLLGEFYDAALFIYRGYIYERANNSFFMNLINGMLRLWNLNGISHQELDHEARFGMATSHFVKAVLKANPGITLGQLLSSIPFKGPARAEVRMKPTAAETYHDNVTAQVAGWRIRSLVRGIFRMIEANPTLADLPWSIVRSGDHRVSISLSKGKDHPAVSISVGTGWILGVTASIEIRMNGNKPLTASFWGTSSRVLSKTTQKFDEWLKSIPPSAEKEISSVRTARSEARSEKNLKAIVLDIGGVIFDHDFRKMAQAFIDVGVRGKSIDEIINLAIFSDPYKAFERDEITPEKFYNELCRMLEIKTLSYGQFLKIWTNIFTLKPETVELIGRVRKMGTKIFFLSDANRLHIQYLKEHYPDVFAKADQIFPSYELGLRKGDGFKVFQALSERLEREYGIRRGEYVFFDDRQENVDRANRVGFSAALFTTVQNVEEVIRKRRQSREKVTSGIVRFVTDKDEQRAVRHTVTKRLEGSRKLPGGTSEDDLEILGVNSNGDYVVRVPHRPDIILQKHFVVWAGQNRSQMPGERPTARAEVRSDPSTEETPEAGFSPEIRQQLLKSIAHFTHEIDRSSEAQLRAMEQFVINNMDKFSDEKEVARLISVLVDIWIRYSKMTREPSDVYEARIRLLTDNVFSLVRILNKEMHQSDIALFEKYVGAADLSDKAAFERLLKEIENRMPEVESGEMRPFVEFELLEAREKMGIAVRKKLHALTNLANEFNSRSEVRGMDPSRSLLSAGLALVAFAAWGIAGDAVEEFQAARAKSNEDMLTLLSFIIEGVTIVGYAAVAGMFIWAVKKLALVLWDIREIVHGHERVNLMKAFVAVERVQVKARHDAMSEGEFFERVQRKTAWQRWAPVAGWIAVVGIGVAGVIVLTPIVKQHLTHFISLFKAVRASLSSILPAVSGSLAALAIPVIRPADKKDPLNASRSEIREKGFDSSRRAFLQQITSAAAALGLTPGMMTEATIASNLGAIAEQDLGPMMEYGSFLMKVVASDPKGQGVAREVFNYARPAQLAHLTEQFNAVVQKYPGQELIRLIGGIRATAAQRIGTQFAAEAGGWQQIIYPYQLAMKTPGQMPLYAAIEGLTEKFNGTRWVPGASSVLDFGRLNTAEEFQRAVSQGWDLVKYKTDFVTRVAIPAWDRTAQRAVELARQTGAPLPDLAAMRATAVTSFQTWAQSTKSWVAEPSLTSIREVAARSVTTKLSSLKTELEAKFGSGAMRWELSDELKAQRDLLESGEGAETLEGFSSSARLFFEAQNQISKIEMQIHELFRNLNPGIDKMDFESRKEKFSQWEEKIRELREIPHEQLARMNQADWDAISGRMQHEMVAYYRHLETNPQTGLTEPKALLQAGRSYPEELAAAREDAVRRGSPADTIPESRSILGWNDLSERLAIEAEKRSVTCRLTVSPEGISLVWDADTVSGGIRPRSLRLDERDALIKEWREISWLLKQKSIPAHYVLEIPQDMPASVIRRVMPNLVSWKKVSSESAANPWPILLSGDKSDIRKLGRSELRHTGNIPPEVLLPKPAEVQPTSEITSGIRLRAPETKRRLLNGVEARYDRIVNGVVNEGPVSIEELKWFVEVTARDIERVIRALRTSLEERILPTAFATMTAGKGGSVSWMEESVNFGAAHPEYPAQLSAVSKQSITQMEKEARAYLEQNSKNGLRFAFAMPLPSGGASALSQWVLDYLRAIQSLRAAFGDRVRGDIRILARSTQLDRTFVKIVQRSGLAKIVEMDQSAGRQMNRFLGENRNALIFDLPETFQGEISPGYSERLVQLERVMWSDVYPIATPICFQAAQVDQITADLLNKIPQILPGNAVAFRNGQLVILETVRQLILEAAAGKLFAQMA